MTPERQARALVTIERNATALTQIIEDILDVSRIIAGKVRLNIQPIDLPVVVKAGSGRCCRLRTPSRSAFRRVHPTTATPEFRADLPRLDGLHVPRRRRRRRCAGIGRRDVGTRRCPREHVDSAEQAVEALERTHPDVLIADIGLAGSDGFESIERVRQSSDSVIP